ncbi:DUF924 domain-containing protein [Deefgea piscis]|uniref:DUF924 domain-containing protein n=1 Tax=Deefgea piscis TaxID=2739061 RepID=A0A6M8SMF9_9NEIS|nr:DUF924 family protein [Deefgea piscis]QKJ66293.1 DUF924 domain-containing protein [Deefgea piscis]
MNQAQAVLDFWFHEIDPALWWAKNGEFDRLIEQRFLALHTAAKRGELFTWRDSAAGRLAEIIVLDQFSRNIYRDQPEAFAQDPQALALAQTAIVAGAAAQLTPIQTSFLYLPLMHSESLLIHQQALALFTALGLPNSLAFELQHQQIIQRFGRYPHRNAILGRVSSAEELDFLQQAGSAF